MTNIGGSYLDSEELKSIIEKCDKELNVRKGINKDYRKAITELKTLTEKIHDVFWESWYKPWT